MPAVIVGCTSNRSVTELGFTSQFSLRQRRHTNDIHAPTTINMCFCLGREQWTFHANICAALMYSYIFQFAGRFKQEFTEGRTERLGKRAMHNYTALKEGIDTALSTIK